jgi:hypothetical protein
MRTTIAIAAAALLAVTAALPAGQMQDRQISAKARWVAHLDVEGLVASGFGKYLLDRMSEKPEAAEGMQKFVETFNMDPTQDLFSVTLYGTEYAPGAGVAILRGQVDHERLLALLDANEAHETLEYGDHTVHTWLQAPEGKDDDGVRHGAFHGEELVVIARAVDMLKHALDVLDGQAGSLAGASDNFLPRFSEGAFLTIAGTDFTVPEDAKPKAAVLLKKIAGVWMELGESRETMFLRAGVTAAGEKDGQQLRDILAGLVALARLGQEHATEMGKELGPWAPLLKGTRVSGGGASVELEVSASLRDVTDMLLQLAEQKEAAAAAANGE